MITIWIVVKKIFFINFFTSVAITVFQVTVIFALKQPRNTVEEINNHIFKLDLHFSSTSV